MTVYAKLRSYSTPDLRDREPRQDRTLESIENKGAGFGRLEQTSCQIHYLEKQNLALKFFSKSCEASSLATDNFLLAVSLTQLLVHSEVVNQRAEIKESLDLETQVWMNSDLSRMDELEPYDWGESDPETIGEPIDW